MKKSVCFLAILLFLICLPALQAQEYGKIRALQQRAAQVIKQRNDFVSQVLTSYAVLHERNADGTVVRLYKDSHWLDVTNIEIVPVLKETADGQRQVTAHQLLFYTADGILNLVSELTIR